MKSKLKIEDNWGNLTYFFNKEDVTEKIEKVKVEWPDKTTEELKVTWSRGCETIYDMGHQYDVHPHIASVTIKHKGLKQDIDIRELNVIDIKLKKAKKN